VLKKAFGMVGNIVFMKNVWHEIICKRSSLKKKKNYQYLFKLLKVKTIEKLQMHKTRCILNIYFLVVEILENQI